MAEKQSAVATSRPEQQGQQQGQPQNQQGSQNRQQNSAQGQQGQNRQEGLRRPPSLFMNPFALLGRLAEEMTGVFQEAGATKPQSGSQSGPGSNAAIGWAPDIDVLQRGDATQAADDLALFPDYWIPLLSAASSSRDSSRAIMKD